MFQYQRTPLLVACSECVPLDVIRILIETGHADVNTGVLNVSKHEGTLYNKELTEDALESHVASSYVM